MLVESPLGGDVQGASAAAGFSAFQQSGGGRLGRRIMCRSALLGAGAGSEQHRRTDAAAGQGVPGAALDQHASFNRSGRTCRSRRTPRMHQQLAVHFHACLSIRMRVSARRPAFFEAASKLSSMYPYCSRLPPGQRRGRWPHRQCNSRRPAAPGRGRSSRRGCRCNWSCCTRLHAAGHVTHRILWSDGFRCRRGHRCHTAPLPRSVNSLSTLLIKLKCGIACNRRWRRMSSTRSRTSTYRSGRCPRSRALPTPWSSSAVSGTQEQQL